MFALVHPEGIILSSEAQALKKPVWAGGLVNLIREPKSLRRKEAIYLSMSRWFSGPGQMLPMFCVPPIAAYPTLLMVWCELVYMARKNPELATVIQWIYR